MRSLLHPIRAVLGSVALLLLGNGLINTLLTLRGTEENFSTTMLGIIMSGYFLGFTCGTWVSGRLIRRIGHIRTFGFCAAICASGALLHVIFVNPWVWLILRIAYGLSFVTLMTVIESWLNSKAATHERGRIFAMYMLVNLGAIAVAQQILRLDTPDGFLLFSLTAILICWALLPITMTRRPQPTIPDRPKSSLKALIGFAPLAITASALSGLAMGAFWAMTPIYAKALGYDIGGIGMVMSITILGGALLQIPIGRFSDRHDRGRVMTIVVILAAILAALMPLAPNKPVLMGLFFVWGGLSFSIYPLAVAQLIDQLHPDEVVSGSADMLVMQGAGSAIAPILAGAIMNVLGAEVLPLYIAAMLALLGVYALYRRHYVSPLIRGEAAHFEPLVQTSPQALEMLFDDTQPDLFDDPSFYEEQERQRLVKTVSQN
ncbi:MFS transporter [Modicisalibacter luteus]|uniref:MFS transporter n=2 Tax=Modicisalibacter luteus TaxID=453962 RepID=A0ABV7M294_9GAMM|nr:MFS transporter [Halomonas lutea]GHA97084.1 MFS transporter [Halomonas lutea]